MPTVLHSSSNDESSESINQKAHFVFDQLDAISNDPTLKEEEKYTIKSIILIDHHVILYGIDINNIPKGINITHVDNATRNERYYVWSIKES